MVATVSMQKPKVVVKPRNLIRSPRNMLIFSFFFCISFPINFVHRTLCPDDTCFFSPIVAIFERG